MVSYQVQPTPSPSSSANSSPPSSPRVAFEHALVTGISRPMNHTEHCALYAFETHARACEACRDPRRVQRAGRALCADGHALAADLAALLYASRSGTVYSAAPADANKPVRVEIPEAFLEASDLLRAVERSVRYKERFVAGVGPAAQQHARIVVERSPKRSKDYHHDGRPERTPSAKKAKDAHSSSEKKYHHSHSSSYDKKASRRSPEIVDWATTEEAPRRAPAGSTSHKNAAYPVVINHERTGAIAEKQLRERSANAPAPAPARVVIEAAANLAGNRGSLYLSDKAELEKRELRERKMAYNLEVREPSSPAREPAAAKKKYHRANGGAAYWR